MRRGRPPLAIGPGRSNGTERDLGIGQARQLTQQQTAGLCQPQAGRDEKLGKQRIALAVAAAPRRVLRAVGKPAAQSHLAEQQVAAKIDVTGIVAPRGALAGTVRRHSEHCAATAGPAKGGAVAEGRDRDDSFLDSPAIELVERGNAPVPARSRDAVGSCRQPTRPVKGQDIVAAGLPDRLAAAPFDKKARPDENVAGVGAPRVRRSRSHSRTGTKDRLERDRSCRHPSG
ncbi:hypothetical protein LMIY3S_00001 [Labrys miyagiensis]